LKISHSNNKEQDFNFLDIEGFEITYKGVKKYATIYCEPGNRMDLFLGKNFHCILLDTLIKDFIYVKPK